MAETADAITSPIAAPPRDPITCHVLDLITGTPAPHLTVSLTLIKPFGPSAPMTAFTNSDGRITHWHAPDGPSLREVLSNLAEHDGGRMVWSLKFETGAYYGEDRTFFPEVEIRFRVEAKEGKFPHYHVPLLLGPYSYTTYRGS